MHKYMLTYGLYNSEIVKWAFGELVWFIMTYILEKKNWRKKSFKILIFPPNAVAKAKLSNILKQIIGNKLKWEYVV